MSYRLPLTSRRLVTPCTLLPARHVSDQMVGPVPQILTMIILLPDDRHNIESNVIRFRTGQKAFMGCHVMRLIRGFHP